VISLKQLARALPQERKTGRAADLYETVRNIKRSPQENLFSESKNIQSTLFSRGTAIGCLYIKGDLLKKSRKGGEGRVSERPLPNDARKG
jgi:hypothetical protein